VRRSASVEICNEGLGGIILTALSRGKKKNEKAENQREFLMLPHTNEGEARAERMASLVDNLIDGCPASKKTGKRENAIVSLTNQGAPPVKNFSSPNCYRFVSLAWHVFYLPHLDHLH
jgi:hypothetical protein